MLDAVVEPPHDDRRDSRSGDFERVGPYALISEVHCGALGARWVGNIVEGVEQGRLVTLRRVELPGGKSRAKHFLYDAARRAETIRHPRVAAVLGVHEREQELVVASEYVEGEVISTLLRLAAREQAPIAHAVALRIARDVLAALVSGQRRWDELVHGAADPLKRALHGGLTPDVVLVASYGDSMLLDLGLSGAGARLPRILKHPSGLPYRAPEQVKRMSSIDERTDVYSAGVLLWEMLANRPLFGAPDRLRHPDGEPLTDAQRESVEDEILSKPIPRLDRIQRTGAPIRPAVVALVARALERQPGQRFQTLQKMLDAIGMLPREVVATDEQVAVSVERLAGALVDSRRSAIETVTGARVVESVPPESTRSTARPAPPSKPIRLLVPPTPLVTGGVVSSPDARFGDEEAPTLAQAQRVATARLGGAAGPWQPRAPTKTTTPGLGAPAARTGLRVAAAPEPTAAPGADGSAVAHDSSSTPERARESAPADAPPAAVPAPQGSPSPRADEPHPAEPAPGTPELEARPVLPVRTSGDGDNARPVSALGQRSPHTELEPATGGDAGPRPIPVSLQGLERPVSKRRGLGQAVLGSAVALLLVGATVVIGLRLIRPDDAGTEAAAPEAPPAVAESVVITSPGFDESAQAPAPTVSTLDAEDNDDAVAAPTASEQSRPVPAVVDHAAPTPWSRPRAPASRRDLKAPYADPPSPDPRHGEEGSGRSSTGEQTGHR